jgi:hypothetical protein
MYVLKKNKTESQKKYSKPMLIYRKIRWELRVFLSQYPGVYLKLVRMIGRKNQRAADIQTHLVIDAYPRSGNTFAEYAFRLCQTREYLLGHHLHAPAQVIWAVKHQIPTLVIIRDPAEAITSFLIYEDYLSTQQAIRYYIRYYNKIKPYQFGYIIVNFKDVVEDFGKVIIRINDNFNTSFKPFVHSKENVEKCFALIEEKLTNIIKPNRNYELIVGRPSEIREAMKEKIRSQLFSEGNKELFIRAEEIYHDLEEKEI